MTACGVLGIVHGFLGVRPWLPLHGCTRCCRVVSTMFLLVMWCVLCVGTGQGNDWNGCSHRLRYWSIAVGGVGIAAVLCALLRFFFWV